MISVAAKTGFSLVAAPRASVPLQNCLSLSLSVSVCLSVSLCVSLSLPLKQQIVNLSLQKIMSVAPNFDFYPQMTYIVQRSAAAVRNSVDESATAAKADDTAGPGSHSRGYRQARCWLVNMAEG